MRQTTKQTLMKIGAKADMIHTLLETTDVVLPKKMMSNKSWAWQVASCMALLNMQKNYWL